MIALWPSGAAPSVSGNLAIVTGRGVQFDSGTVRSVGTGPCGSPSAHRAFVGVPESPPVSQGQCRQAVVDITSGPDAGSQTLLPMTGGPGEPDLEAGDHLRLSRTQGGGDPGAYGGGGTLYDFEDFARGLPLGMWALAAAVVVCAVAAWRGFRALIGVGVALAVIVGFTLPSLLDGNSPVLLALVTGSMILFVVVYLAHGVNLRASAALLGTLASLALAAGLSWLAIDTATLTGLAEESNTTIQAYLGSVSVTGLLLAGFIIGSLGVLNDVTISQAATVFELAGADRSMGVRSLFASAMRVGRDHIASMIYTLVLAYVGSTLPLLLIFAVSQRSLADIITSDVVAVEVVRSLVGAMAVVLSVPLTTVVAAMLTRGTDARTLAAGPGHHH
ncbi:YibE/F family protein [Rhodococcus sp. D2-41]|nr:YibE/F family protein [Rhodococcus sp. D2-41]